MSIAIDHDINRWTAKHRSALVLDITLGRTTVAEASRAYDSSPSEIEARVDDGERGMGTARCA